MNEHAKNLRRTRADMLGTDDEAHYLECHKAADEIERLWAALKDIVAAEHPSIGSDYYPPLVFHGFGCPHCIARSALENYDE